MSPATPVIIVRRVRCPGCDSDNHRVYGTRPSDDGNIQRYCRCVSCGKRFHVIATDDPALLIQRSELALYAVEPDKKEIDRAELDAYFKQGTIDIQKDPLDTRKWKVCGKSVYLGDYTYQACIFEALISPVGRSIHMEFITEIVDGRETSDRVDSSEEEIKLARARAHKGISLLRKALREHKADDHLVLVSEGDSYMLAWRFTKRN